MITLFQKSRSRHSSCSVDTEERITCGGIGSQNKVQCNAMQYILNSHSRLKVELVDPRSTAQLYLQSE